MPARLDRNRIIGINRRVWDAFAPDWRKWVDNIGLTAAFFRRGGVSFDSLDLYKHMQASRPQRKRIDALVRKLAGPVRGKKVLDLQCGEGEAALSWANLGARVTGADLSAERIALAREKAAAAGVRATYVRADALRLPFKRRSFDLVYTGGGVVGWLPDLNPWARGIARVLKPGGRFLLFDFHPLLHCVKWRKGRPRLGGDYFDRGPKIYGRRSRWGAQVESVWKLADIVSALAGAGLKLAHMVELPIPGKRGRKTGLPHRVILLFEIS